MSQRRILSSLASSVLVLAAATGARSQNADLRPDGARLQPSDVCFVLSRTRDGAAVPLGRARQIIRSDEFEGRAVWDVVVHQKADGFDLRDHFVLDAATLHPVRFDSRRDGSTHIELSYSAEAVAGARISAQGRSSVHQPLDQPVWEGNLWGVTFGALPLAPGATFELPTYQYDAGLGSFTLRVTGERIVDTPTGQQSAWVVDAGTGPERRAEYWIAKATGAELGYAAGPMSSNLGGDCADIG